MTIANYLDLTRGVLFYKDTAPGAYHKIFVDDGGNVGEVHLLGVNSFRVIGIDVYGNEVAVTARREQAKKGPYFYWYANKKRNGKLHKTYIGHDINVDIDAIVGAMERLLLRRLDHKLIKGLKVKVTP
jgi:hypothetical protein